MKLRQTQNTIAVLEDENGNIVTDQSKIAELLINHFEEKFKFQEVRFNQNFFQDIRQLVSADENAYLDVVPSDEEVKRAVFKLDPDSSPRPDGFAGCFYRYAWEIFGNDITKAIQHCWRCGFIPQGAFIKGRNIQEQIVISSELVNELDVKRRGGNLGIKLDISQAYDSLSWEFLFQVMRKFGFSEKDVNWIHTLLQSARISVLFNGGHVGYFQVGRGLRQSDTLSPLLFVIAEDLLSRAISRMVQSDKRNVKKLATLLKEYQEASGQIFNLEKSKCFIGGTSTLRKQQITSECRMPLANFPDKYLGVYLTPDRIKTQHIWNCVEQIQASLAGWMEGGVGLRRLEIMNKAFLMKLWWKIQNNKEDWAKFFQEKFITKKGDWIGYYKKSSILPGLKWISEDVQKFTRWIVGTESKISIWNDIWIKDKTLCELYPDNAYLNEFPDMKVENLIVDNEWVMPSELLDMVSINELPVLSLEEDKRIWSGTITGDFSVYSAVECIRTKYSKVSWVHQLWNYSIHPNISSNICKLIRNICPTDEK
ncbi:uncharacterized protein LOC113309691 [Papaver somniferum]|uniref:uncharacterized protein LOC113309691 n=1 Tax=Papaver somniferum TaxID=3469 RepID=UPI000E701CEE|nr:uncharacterized protein LOC113309691 [Papaver somniferum]